MSARKGENMEDRYLFKAKRIDNGEWVCGSYVYTFCEDKDDSQKNKRLGG